MMIRPQEAVDVPIDLEAVMTFFANAIGIEPEAVAAAMAAANSGQPQDPGSVLRAFTRALPGNQFTTFLQAFAEAPDAIPKPPKLAGLMDDGYGSSGLTNALEATSNERLLQIRELVRALRAGQVERAFSEAASQTATDRELLCFAADWASVQRKLLRGNPKLAAYIFCSYLVGDGPPIPPPRSNRIDVDGFLRAWRDSRRSC
jgi:hypothetical protein